MNIKDFIDELKKINIEINEKQLEQLNKYYELLCIWNEKINLTRIVKKEEVYLKHFYDSATLNSIIELNSIENICDFGTGAGFPGIVIKILFPKIHITLVDSLNKRIKFLNEVIKNLDLKDIEAVHSRIEDYAKQNREKYDLVVARAVASLNILLEYSAPIIKINKNFVAMKANIDEELENCKNAMQKLSLELVDRKQFTLPKEESKRNLLLFKKKKATEKKYPRSSCEIKKKPL